MEFDYDMFEDIIVRLVANSDIPDFVEDFEIGEDISFIDEVKVIFDGFGYNEETNEQDNYDMQSFAVFLHRNIIKGETFPPHELTPWALIHRPKEEVCLYVWYDAISGDYEVLPVDYRSFADDEGSLTNEEIMEIIMYLKERYFNNEDEE
jgi:hypothetical protein